MEYKIKVQTITTDIQSIESDDIDGAMEIAEYENGHNSYSGTISEKNGYVMSEKPSNIDADKWFDMLESFDEEDKSQKYYSELKEDFDVYDDKWAAALCIPTKNGFIFCGLVSS